MSNHNQAPFDNTHSFNIRLAEKYGIKEAILINHIQFWVNHNQKKKCNYHEGRTWTFQTLEDIAHHFPYLSTSSVFDTLEKLCTGKQRKSKSEDLDFEPVLMKGNFNKNAYDRTTWYAFVDEDRFTQCAYQQKRLGTSQNRDGHLPKTIIQDTNKDDSLSRGRARGERQEEADVHERLRQPDVAAAAAADGHEGHRCGTIPRREIVAAADGLPDVALLAAHEKDALYANAIRAGLGMAEAVELVDRTIVEYRLECGANQASHNKPFWAIQKWVTKAVADHKKPKSTTRSRKSGEIDSELMNKLLENEKRNIVIGEDMQAIFTKQGLRNND